MMLGVEPPTLCYALNASFWVGSISSKMLEGLINRGKDGALRPLLAERWAISEDGLTVTLHLRRGVTWHDGKPFGAADVAFTIREVWLRLQARAQAILRGMAEIETPDDHTVILRLARANSSLATLLSAPTSQILPKHIFEGGNIMQNPALAAPIGTGPFVFKEWRKGQFIELAPNPSYWQDGKPRLSGIYCRFVGDPGSRAAALENGEAFFAPYSPAPASDVERLRRLPNLEITTRGYETIGTVQVMEVNTRHPVLADKRVRRALSMAINRRFIVDNVFFGLAAPAEGFMPAASPWRLKESSLLNFDVAQANRLLDDAGHAGSGRGPRFTLRLTHNQTGENPRTAEYLRQALARIRIDLRLEQLDLGTYLRRIYTDIDFDLSIATFGMTDDPALAVHRLVAPEFTMRGLPFGNSGGWSSPALFEMFNEAWASSDDARRRVLFDGIQRTLMDELPNIYLTEPAFFSVANKRLRDYDLTALAPTDGFADAYLAAP